MRATQIEQILKPYVFDVIDTNIPFFDTNKLFRSFGFRFKKGPLISKINTYIKRQFKDLEYDLIWVDKGVYLQPRTMNFLKCKTKQIVHFTPDMAFYENRSKLFEKTLPFYDFSITTKTIEEKEYLKFLPQEKLLITTQGFSKTIHKPYHKFEDKLDAVVFIGLAEPYRFEVAKALLDSGIVLHLVGKKWDSFVKRHGHLNNFKFLGEALHDEAYSKLISSSKFALGLLSKRFPELHTTRTFEIPACGTALLTEKNVELDSYYSSDEVVFYKNNNELIERINFYINHPLELKALTDKGRNKVLKEGYDYESILRSLLETILK
jgi:glycosyltransferase involved in cell wall biosynthesis